MLDLKTNRCVDLHKFRNFHTARQREVVTAAIRLLCAHLLNLPQLALPLSLFSRLPQSCLLQSLRSRLGSIIPWVIKLFMAAVAEVITLVLVNPLCCQLVSATPNLALDAFLVESFSVCCIHPISGVDRNQLTAKG